MPLELLEQALKLGVIFIQFWLQISSALPELASLISF